MEKLDLSEPSQGFLRAARIMSFSAPLSSLAQNNLLDSINLGLLTVKSIKDVQDQLQNLHRSLKYLNLVLTGLWVRDEFSQQPAGRRRWQPQLDYAMRSDWSIYPCCSDPMPLHPKVLTMFFPSCPALTLHLLSLSTKKFGGVGMCPHRPLSKASETDASVSYLKSVH